MHVGDVFAHRLADLFQKLLDLLRLSLGHHKDPSVGQIFALFIMAIAAAEAAIGLSIVVAVYRHYKTVDAEDLVNLKG